MINTGKLSAFKTPSEWTRITTIDMHTCGEPLRIITGGIPEIKGATILEKRKYFSENHDNLRRALIFEPRGHADMYGAVITEPVTEGADFGTFFMHNEGYSTMCGHAIIALAKFVVDTGLLESRGSSVMIGIDAPPGRISAVARKVNGTVQSVSFLNVPSFVLIRDEVVEVPGIGRVEFDVAFGGAFYAFCDAGRLGLRLDASDYYRLIDYGKRIKKAVMENFSIGHPFEDDLGFLYGVIFTGAPYNPENWSRNVCIFADGEVDRSPTGTGVSARAAIHHARGELQTGQEVTIESILGSTMQVKVEKEIEYGDFDAVIPEVTATASFTGRNEFWIDPGDTLREGFIFR